MPLALLAPFFMSVVWMKHNAFIGFVVVDFGGGAERGQRGDYGHARRVSRPKK